MTPSRRQRRVSELIKEELGTFLERHASDPRLEWVNITSVEATPDLKVAHVYFSIIGDEASPQDALEGLQHAAGFLRRELAARLRLRHVPQLAFSYDESLDRGRRIDEILDAIRGEDASDDNA